MINSTASDTQQLFENNTAELKQKLLKLTQNGDLQPLKQKVQFYHTTKAMRATIQNSRGSFDDFLKFVFELINFG